MCILFSGLRLSPLRNNRKYTMKGTINTPVSSEIREPSTLQLVHEVKPSSQIRRQYELSLIELQNKLQRRNIQAKVEEMARIQEKKYITVKQFSEIYNISKTAQQGFRGRLRDPLPFRQTVPRGKITYVVKEVEEWFGNQNK